jgi:hypothetical protein
MFNLLYLKLYLQKQQPAKTAASRCCLLYAHQCCLIKFTHKDLLDSISKKNLLCSLLLKFGQRVVVLHIFVQVDTITFSPTCLQWKAPEAAWENIAQPQMPSTPCAFNIIMCKKGSAERPRWQILRPSGSHGILDNSGNALMQGI